MLDQLSLLDWKRQVFGIYAEIRATPDPAEGWRRWRELRDELFARHAQSPLPEHVRKGFQNLDYFDYDPAYRVIGAVSNAEPKHYEIGASGGGSFAFDRFASVRSSCAASPASWSSTGWRDTGEVCFCPLPTRQAEARHAAPAATSSTRSRAPTLAPRTVGWCWTSTSPNPSCSYDPAWVCPLAPPPNRLGFAIPAGERHESD